jgi:solute carrier family 35 protein
MTILIIKSVWKRKWPPPRITASVSLVVLGCLIAGAGDLTFDGTAYAFAFSSVLMQALYLLLVEFQVSRSLKLLYFRTYTSCRITVAIVVQCGD